MCNTPVESYGNLPSPPLSPFRHCDGNLEIEPLICDIQEKDNKGEETLCSPVENTNIISEEDVLRMSFMNIIDDELKLMMNLYHINIIFKRYIKLVIK